MNFGIATNIISSVPHSLFSHPFKNTYFANPLPEKANRYTNLPLLDLELLIQLLGRSLDTLVDLLRLRAVALSRGLLAARSAADNLGHGRGPLLGGHALR